MGKTYTDKIRKVITDLSSTNIREIIDWFKRYSGRQFFSQSEIDVTIQELIEYYYLNK